ncbi:hypothetical protein PPYR_02729 [Photinus pyralis]|uniref:Peptidase S1 domain-containing protein n=1 Tax=Photinus pyralis TaxID=7054 RepID=A0A1Y1L163_PHOPY|nr:chymotrypsin-1-like [Photinus pyralis]KAB0790929.1 hypothetical protein PPYR_02729 [Photinus pyralis]
MWVTVLALLVASVGAESGHWNEKVLGGATASDGKFPFTASLQDANNKHYCTAAIISKKCIISNAACSITAQANNFRIVVGASKLSAGGTVYQIGSIVKPATYNETSFLHNIAVIKPTKDIVFNDKIKPIRLTNKITPPRTSVTYTGWGMTKYPDTTMSDTLQYISLVIQEGKDCDSGTVPGYPNERKLCTATAPGVGLCKGDLGGPLIEANSLVGVSSTLYECAQGNPDTYEDIFSWRDWIRSQCDIPFCI